MIWQQLPGTALAALNSDWSKLHTALLNACTASWFTFLHSSTLNTKQQAWFVQVYNEEWFPKQKTADSLCQSTGEISPVADWQCGQENEELRYKTFISHNRHSGVLKCLAACKAFIVKCVSSLITHRRQRRWEKGTEKGGDVSSSCQAPYITSMFQQIYYFLLWTDNVLWIPYAKCNSHSHTIISTSHQYDTVHCLLITLLGMNHCLTALKCN